MLDDDQPADAPHHACAPEDDEPSSFGMAGPAQPIGPCPNSSEACTDPRTNGEKNTADHLAKYNVDNPMNHEQEEGNESHKDGGVRTRTLVRGGGDNGCSGSDSGTDSDAPASVGRIHDVFAEYEETFGLPKSKQQAARSTLPDCSESETTAGSTPHDFIRGDPRVTADGGVTDVEQAAEAVGGDAARPSQREIGNGSTFWSRQEIIRRETATAELRSPGVHALAGNCRSGKFSPCAVERRPLNLIPRITENIGALQRPPLSSSPMTTEVAIGSGSGAAAQGTPYRKRSLSFTQPMPLTKMSLKSGLAVQRKRRGRLERPGRRKRRRRPSGLVHHRVHPAPNGLASSAPVAVLLEWTAGWQTSKTFT